MSVDTTSDSHALVTTSKRLPAGVDQLPSGAYRARVVVNGRQVSIGTFPNMTAAGRAAARERAEIARGNWVDPKRAGVTLDVWFVMWLPNRNIRPKTRENDQRAYARYISPWLGRMPLHRLTPYQIQTWLTALSERQNPATVRKAHSLLGTALGVRGAMGDQRITANPCRVVRPPSHKSPDWTLLTTAEINAVIAVTPAQWQPLLIVLADTGVRWSEAMGLQRADYNPLRKTLHVQRSRDTKGRTQPTKNRRDRHVPLSSRAVEAFNRLVEGKATTDWVFYGSSGSRQPSHSYFAGRILKPACRTAISRSVRVHDLRHSCASRLLAGGATLAEVRDFLGHSSVTVTELYLHTDQDALARTVLRALG